MDIIITVYRASTDETRDEILRHASALAHDKVVGKSGFRTVRLTVTASELQDIIRYIGVPDNYASHRTMTGIVAEIDWAEIGWNLADSPK